MIFQLFVNRLRGAAVTSIAAAAVVTSPVSAQFDPSGFAEMMQHDYLHRDVVLFSQGLRLDDYQRLILDSLFEDYRDNFDAGWKGTMERIENLRHEALNIDRSKVMELVMGPFENWRTEKQQLKEQFERDVRAILNPEQAERWPSFYRQMTREKTLHQGRLSGEGLNLFNVIRDMRLNDRLAMDLEPLMEQYSHELHDVLVSRNRLLQNRQASTLRSLRTHGAMPTHDVNQEVNARILVREVNLRYIDEIAERLPEEESESFRVRAWEMALPRVHRPLPTARALSRAMNLSDLDDNTREAVADLQAMYEVEMDHLNARLKAAVLDFEPRQIRDQAEVMAARQAGQPRQVLEDPTRTIVAERNDRAGHYLRQLHDLLTPEQIAHLPRAGRESPIARSPVERAERQAIGRRGDAAPELRATPERGSDRGAGRGEQRRERGGRDLRGGGGR